MGKGRAAGDSAEELREATREAHQVLKDLRRERREVGQLVAGVRDEVRAEIKDQLKVEMDRVMEELKEYVERATSRVFRRFDTISDVMLGEGGPRGRPRLEEMAAAWLRDQPEEMRGAVARRMRANLAREEERLASISRGATANEYMDPDGQATWPDVTPQGLPRPQETVMVDEHHALAKTEALLPEVDG